MAFENQSCSYAMLSHKVGGTKSCRATAAHVAVNEYHTAICVRGGDELATCFKVRADIFAGFVIYWHAQIRNRSFMMKWRRRRGIHDVGDAVTLQPG